MQAEQAKETTTTESQSKQSDWLSILIVDDDERVREFHCKILKSLNGSVNIAITANPAEKVRRKCRCSLFNEYIQKPIDIQQLQKNRNSNNSTRLNVITQPPRLNTTNYCRPIHTKLVLAV